MSERSSLAARMGTGRFGRRRALATAGLATGAAAFAAACGGDNKDSDTGGTSGGGATSSLPSGQAGSTAIAGGAGPKRGGIRRSAGGPLGAELDPHKTNDPYISGGIWQWAANFIYRWNKEGLTEPDLATAMPEFADGGTTVTIKLNPAAKWQPRAPVNGRLLDSEDVKFTIERIKDPKTVSPRASFFAGVDSIQTPDANTVVLKMKVPEADLLAKMADQYQVVVPKEWAGKDKPVTGAADVVGTGPYMLDSYVLDQGYKMSRRPDGYWKPNTAWLDGIDFRRVDDTQASLAALRAGQTDSGSVRDDLKAFEADKATYYMVYWRNPTREALLLNQNKPLYKDVRVRQAIWRSIDRKSIYDKVFNGLGFAGGAMTPAATPWVLPDSELERMPGFLKDRNADIAEAKKLLAAAGYPDGFEDTMTTVTAFNTADEADLYVPMLQRIGVRYKLDNIGTDFTQFVLREVRREYSAAATLFLSGPYPDAQLNQYHFTGASRNYADFTDPKLDAMMTAQSQELDINKRKAIVLDIQRELINNPSGFIWVGSRGESDAYRNYFKGFFQPNGVSSFSVAENGYFDK